MDALTTARERASFARVLVDVEIYDKPPLETRFVDESGNLVEQRVYNEWWPTQCKHCHNFGRGNEEYKRKEKIATEIRKEKVEKEKVSQQSEWRKVIKKGKSEEHEKEEQGGKEWVMEFLDSFVTVKVEGISDHTPLLVQLTEEERQCSKSFRFFNMWCQSKEFLKLVKELWEKPMQGISMYRLVVKLKRLKPVLKHLNRTQFSDIQLKMQPKQSSSWHWKRLLELKERVKDEFQGTRWKHTKSGKYSGTSGYNSLTGQGVVMTAAKLLTKDRLLKLNMLKDGLECIFCQKETETSEHLFIECTFPSELIKATGQWVSLPGIAVEQMQWRNQMLTVWKNQKLKRRTKSGKYSVTSGYNWLPCQGVVMIAAKKLASIIREPLKTDVPTMNMSRPSIARVCVEVDLFRDLPSRIRLGTEEQSYYQPVTYENLPDYCLECRKIGHDAKYCRHGKPRSTPSEVQNKKQTADDHSKIRVQAVKTDWKPKEKMLESNTVGIKDKDPSTSGLTAAERFQILTDIQEDGYISEQEGNTDEKSMAQETDVSNSDMELDFTDLQLDQGQNSKMVGSSTKDDSGIGKSDNTTRVEDARLVASDGEGKKKKPGRPKTSTKTAKKPGPKTRTSTRISRDPPRKKVINELSAHLEHSGNQ
ncbi:OLC1v1018679C1 [Oldenlandia corymbosa var. corymbosa]|uniref:OLC1v1018679C1 n=1 Tax=Oldenlandia corymbosa var. corymbosa TaxID=529605 RepID=A0AAV1EC98_OLDCO|nr:OLC1v1018679C1 [Oldenlandia corymbosa var. corymbosa]